MSLDAISFVSSAAGVGPEAVSGGFFEGWATPPTPDEHVRILKSSAHVVLAWSNDQVVGFVNAISDGVLAAYIPLLEVLPRHRASGIGSELIRRLLAEVQDLYMVDVVCDDKVLPFYERLGFSGVGRSAVVRNYGWRER